MKKIAVFGCNGYLGQNLVKYLIDDKNSIVVGFDLNQEYSGDSAITYKKIDVTSRIDINGFEEGFDTIYYFSGLTGTDISIERYDSFINVNEIGFLNLLNRIQSFSKKPKIIFPSTRLVYKGIDGVPLCEDAEKEFKTIYASSKYNGEKYLAMHKNLFELDYTVFRIGVPYGNLVANAMSYGTVGFFLGKAQKGEDISIYGDGGARRTFTHVWDICRQIVEVAALPASNGQVFNIDGENLSLRETATLIAKKYSVNLHFTAWPKYTLKFESGDTIFNSNRIRAILPETCTFRLDKWIEL